jgi:hypothetical protein
MDCFTLSSTGLYDIDANTITSDNITVYSKFNVSGFTTLNNSAPRPSIEGLVCTVTSTLWAQVWGCRLAAGLGSLRLWGGCWRGARWRGPLSPLRSTGHRPPAGPVRLWGCGRLGARWCGPSLCLSGSCSAAGFEHPFLTPLSIANNDPSSL